MLLILSAPSGTGKTTLVKRLLRDMSGLVLSVSYTTRKPRLGEINGVDYWFVSEVDFQKRKESGDFLESARVHGAWYGTSLSQITDNERQGKVTLLDIDTQGALAVKSKRPDSVMIFLLPPSKKELENRLLKRGTEDRATLNKRLRAAQGEIAMKDHYKYVIINDELEKTLRTLKEILEKEQLNPHAQS